MALQRAAAVTPVSGELTSRIGAATERLTLLVYQQAVDSAAPLLAASRTLCASGNLAGAADSAQKACAVYERIGRTHTEGFAAALFALGCVQLCQSATPERAMPTLLQCLSIRSALLPAGHPAMVQCEAVISAAREQTNSSEPQRLPGRVPSSTVTGHSVPQVAVAPASTVGSAAPVPTTPLAATRALPPSLGGKTTSTTSAVSGGDNASPSAPPAPPPVVLPALPTTRMATVAPVAGAGATAGNAGARAVVPVAAPTATAIPSAIGQAVGTAAVARRGRQELTEPAADAAFCAHYSNNFRSHHLHRGSTRCYGFIPCAPHHPAPQAVPPCIRGLRSGAARRADGGGGFHLHS